jgi:hypothetical protein
MPNDQSLMTNTTQLVYYLFVFIAYCILPTAYF